MSVYPPDDWLWEQALLYGLKAAKVEECGEVHEPTMREARDLFHHFCEDINDKRIRTPDGQSHAQIMNPSRRQRCGTEIMAALLMGYYHKLLNPDSWTPESLHRADAVENA